MTDITQTYRRLANVVAIVAMALACALPGYSYPVEKYATTSAMASGTWVKIRVAEDGMQLVSNEQLREMGFTDPSKVNVYGYGGRLIEETLHADHPDDLPRQMCVHTAKGIVFFGVASVRWKANATGQMQYSHELNYFSNDSYYFLSDADTKGTDLVRPSGYSEGMQSVDTFRERLLHEQDLFAPGVSGRQMLGEDFRSKTTQTFNFSLPGKVEGSSVYVGTNFGALASMGISSLIFKANGKQLPSTTSDKIAVNTSSDRCMETTFTVKEISDIANALNFEIKFVAGAALSMARLDYIQVEYERAISLEGVSDLYFSIDPQGCAVEVAGVKSGTQIWDVTDVAAPVRIDYTLKGSTALFYTSTVGQREYVAFHPESVSRKVETVEKVENQNFHAMEVPDMVIIAPAEYMAQARRLAEMHERVDGMSVYLMTPQQCYNEFSSGTPDVSAFRKALKMWYDRSTPSRALKHCLIFGRPTYDNRMITDQVKAAGYTRVPIWQSVSTADESSSYSTDAFVAMLEDVDGSFLMGRAKLSVAVGRLPVKSVTEATEVVTKIIDYVENPILGKWRNRVMIIADNADKMQHVQQAEDVYSALTLNGGEGHSYDRLYLDLYKWESRTGGHYFRIPHEKLLQGFSDGIMYMDYIGHASPINWGHEGLLPWTDIVSLSNKRLPWILAATCEFARFDADDLSGAEHMLLNPSGGAIGFFTTTRRVYVQQNGSLNNEISKRVFQPASDGNAKTFGQIFVDGLNGRNVNDDNKLRYQILGDPAIRIFNPSRTLELQQINGKAVGENSSDMPEIGARGKAVFRGVVRKADGSVDKDFNGKIEVTLYDAERALETLGQSEEKDDAWPYAYNDHTNLLYAGLANVKEGAWEISVVVPVEIDNNYTPALFNMYAYSDEGVEANGASTGFYVYGVADNPVEDKEGPEISDFFINNPAFADGDIVSDTMTLYASLSDESGICMASTAIGHNISVTIDGRIAYDATEGFTPDTSESGTVVYTLSGVEPGTHEVKLTAWDNAGNSSSAVRTVSVSAYSMPRIYDVTTNVNPAKTDVTFTVSHDLPASRLDAKVEVFDLSGRKMWENSVATSSSAQGNIDMYWDLADSTGARVPRGIYVYRATITTEDGKCATKSKKLAVTAP